MIKINHWVTAEQDTESSAERNLQRPAAAASTCAAWLPTHSANRCAAAQAAACWRAASCQISCISLCTPYTCICLSIGLLFRTRDFDFRLSECDRAVREVSTRTPGFSGVYSRSSRGRDAETQRRKWPSGPSLVVWYGRPVGLRALSLPQPTALHLSLIHI